MLRIREKVVEKMIAQAERDYPYETCGLLLGKFEENGRTVFGAYEVKNSSHDRRNDRYEIDPRDYMKAEEKAKEFGLDIVGVYHSHPDHPDSPSQFDRDRAFEGWSYIIFSIVKGKAISYRSWELINEKFREEEVHTF